MCAASRHPASSWQRGVFVNFAMGAARVGIVAALAGGGLTSAPAPAQAEVKPCASVAIFGLRGSGQTAAQREGWGQEMWLLKEALTSRLRAQGRTVAQFPVSYSSASVELLTRIPPLVGKEDYYLNVKSYIASVRNGADGLDTSLYQRASRCPNEAPVLVGYSQGALAIRLELRRIAVRGDTWLLRRIGAVGLTGDPTKQANDYNIANAPARSRGVSTTTRLGGPIDVPDGVLGRTVLSCVDSDLVCDFSLQSFRNHGGKVHREAYGPERADRLARELVAPIMRRSQPAPVVPHAPPPAGEPAPVPVPLPTFTETTGGVTHTWTNYLNAGGSEGPTIDGQQTVQISCKLQGFQVADGNTWWYRIASAPWSDVYFASADAFYNNGATSGSLLGTPFVDPAVRNCAGSTGGGGDIGALAETTGGVTHTWTNYLNAGGTEGPTIGGQQTVQISCKLQGFQVADGNTWWYRITSAPWSDVYYASADAFYNNGATSGSLIGTPFVDPTVHDCRGA
jgi:hypothetical protein